jgi:hypothetical protein
LPTGRQVPATTADYCKTLTAPKPLILFLQQKIL